VPRDDLPVLGFTSQPAWQSWLAEHHADAPGAWLRIAKKGEARAFFATLSSVNRYAILYRIGDARRPETRARRIAKYVAMLAAHETIHPQS
jgi:uncharacterized protein YdeI (YjbR/CyaY-like superfamily)